MFITGVSLVFTIIYLLLLYGGTAICLYKIAVNANVRNKWLAFVPILQFYIIGSICEEYEIKGFTIKHLEWVLCLVVLLNIFCGFSMFFLTKIIQLLLTVFMALVMHKFCFLYDPKRAFLYAILCVFGKIPLLIVLFLLRDKPMTMSQGAYSYPFQR